MTNPPGVRCRLIVFMMLSPLVVPLATAQSKQKAPSPSVPSKSSAASVAELTPVSNPATAAQIRELLDLTGASRNANLLVGRMIDQVKQQAPPFFPQDFWTDMEQSLRRLDAESLMVPYFQKYYSQPDVEKAIAFYKSPAGKRLIAVQPVIMQKAQNTVMQRAQEVGHQVLLRHRAEIEALAKQYGQQHGAAGGSATGDTGGQSGAPQGSGSPSSPRPKN